MYYSKTDLIPLSMSKDTPFAQGIDININKVSKLSRRELASGGSKPFERRQYPRRSTEQAGASRTPTPSKIFVRQYFYALL